MELTSDSAAADERNSMAAARVDPAGPSRILIACMPKSGSTFLSDIVSALPGFRRAKFSPTPSGGRQHELDATCLTNAGRGNFVGQVHILNSDWTTKMCRDYRLKPVVLVRSLPDAVVSLRDHIRREGGAGPIFQADPHLTTLDDATLEEMIVRFQAPWHVNFYMSWRNEPGTLMISYEELTADPERILRQIVDFAGAAVDDRAVARAVAESQARRESRFNVGVTGRGAALRPQLLRDLVTLFDFYPEAADDPYVKGVRAQVSAALEGRSAPPLGPVAIRPADPPPAVAERPRRSVRFLAAVRRSGYQITLIAVGFLYWVWPEDLIPDDKWYGRADDAAFLTILAFLAGRVSKRTPGLRDLPAYVARVVSRRLRRSR